MERRYHVRGLGLGCTRYLVVCTSTRQYVVYVVYCNEVPRTWYEVHNTSYQGGSLLVPWSDPLLVLTSKGATHYGDPTGTSYCVSVCTLTSSLYTLCFLHFCISLYCIRYQYIRYRRTDIHYSMLMYTIVFLYILHRARALVHYIPDILSVSSLNLSELSH